MKRKPVFGLSDEWLLHDGRVIATVLALSQKEQLSRLARDSPAAAERAIVLGDLAFDQLSASASRRDAYRQSLGVAPDKVLVHVGSRFAAGRTPRTAGETGVACPISAAAT